MKNKFLIFFLIIVCCAALLPGCNETPPAPPKSLVEYALEVEDGLLKPKGLEYGMTVEEVCKIKGLQISDLEVTRNTTSKILRITSIDGLYDVVHEHYWFIEEKLTSIQYVVIPDESVVEELFAQEKAHTKAFLPESMIQDHNETRWEDAQGNEVRMSTAHSDEGFDPDVICFDIIGPAPSK